MIKKLALALFFIPLACGGNERRQPDRPIIKLASITVAPAMVTIEKGRGITFTATGVYDDGSMKDLSDEVMWSSADEAVARIDAAGVAIGVDTGTTIIRATKDMFTGESMVMVAGAPLVSIELQPKSSDLIIGESVMLSAFGTFADDLRLDISANVEWISSDNTIATVAGGVVTTLAPGFVTIDAREPITMISSAAMNGSATVNVRVELPVQITVAPGSSMVPEGLTQQYSATAVYSDQSTRDVTAEVMWSSTSPVVAMVSNMPGTEGLARCITDGITSIEAHHVASGLRASGTLRVLPPAVARVDVSPATPTVGQGEQLDFSAVATYTDGMIRDITASATWSSSDTNIVIQTMNQRNTFLAVGAGMARIIAIDPVSNVSSELTMTSATLTVTPPSLQSIAVLPIQSSTPLGVPVQYQAFGIFSDNSSQDISPTVNWGTSENTIATISNTGLVTPVSVGVVLISASDPVSGISSNDSNLSAELTVEPAALLSIYVSPAARAMIVGTSHQFTATGRYTDGTEVNQTNNFLWQSSGPSISMNATGLATAQSNGTVSIVATDFVTGISSDLSGESALVTVSDATLVSISVTPTSTSAPLGAELQFIATGTYDNTATADLSNVVTWSTTNATAVEVSNVAGSRGRAITRGLGAATISALDQASGVNGSATFNVVPDNLVSLAVTPRPSTVDVNRTRQFTAHGLFASGGHYNLTNNVTWNSSNPALATISNTEGTRGLASGVAVGNLTISALDTTTGISSDNSSQSAAVTVLVGRITVSNSWNGPVVSIDSTLDYAINVGQVVFSPSTFTPAQVVQDVNIAINFLKTDGTCAVPDVFNAYHNETNFRLQGPTGLQVILAAPNTWSGGTAISPVTITFDQQSANIPSGTPVTGTYQPVGGDLNMFNGTAPAGTWILQAGDNAGGDPLCVFSYTITVVAE